jgi:hypothetical protein
MSAVAELPPHAIEAVRELARRQVPMQKIALMTNLSLQTVLKVITVVGTDQEFAVIAKDLKDHRSYKIGLRSKRNMKISEPTMKIATKRLGRWKKKAVRTKSPSRSKASV